MSWDDSALMSTTEGTDRETHTDEYVGRTLSTSCLNLGFIFILIIIVKTLVFLLFRQYGILFWFGNFFSFT